MDELLLHSCYSSLTLLTYIRFIYSYVCNKVVWGTQASMNCCQHSFMFIVSSFIFSCLDQPMTLRATIKFCLINCYVSLMWFYIYNARLLVYILCVTFAWMDWCWISVDVPLVFSHKWGLNALTYLSSWDMNVGCITHL